MSYSGTDEIPVSPLPEMEKCRKVNLIRQNHLTVQIFKVLCSSCDGVLLKLKRKTGGPPV
jgi:hypothetical protein